MTKVLPQLTTLAVSFLVSNFQPVSCEVLPFYMPLMHAVTTSATLFTQRVHKIRPLQLRHFIQKPRVLLHTVDILRKPDNALLFVLLLLSLFHALFLPSLPTQ